MAPARSVLRKSTCWQRATDAGCCALSTSVSRDAELPCTVVCAQAMDNIHAILDDGGTLIGVPVFAEAYRRADLPLLAWLISRPCLRWLLEPAYALFARHRAGVSALLGPPLLRLVQWAYR
jgi:hypothetical protein